MSVLKYLPFQGIPHWRLIAVVAILPLLGGCGKPPMIPVTGTVKINGKPIANCKVGLVPDKEEFDPEKDGYGFGFTDKDGKFEVQHPKGDKGIYAGKYKVTFLAWIDSTGKPLPPDIKPSEVEGGAKNLFPDMYESISTTPERWTIDKKSTHRDFDLQITTK